jgi:hypothetical protein
MVVTETPAGRLLEPVTQKVRILPVQRGEAFRVIAMVLGSGTNRSEWSSDRRSGQIPIMMVNIVPRKRGVVALSPFMLIKSFPSRRG